MSLKVIRNERVIMCDIDDTLVMHDCGPDHFANKVGILDTTTTDKVFLVPNKNMVRLVKEEIARGSEVVFWSRGGYQWAHNVLVALGFDKVEGKEFLVLTKPMAYFDDRDVNDWLKDRVYLAPNIPYK